MNMVSDSRPNENDVLNCVGQLRTNRISDVLSKKQAIKMRKKQDELVNNYTYTKEDVEKSIQARMSKKVMNIGMERTRAGIAVQAARDDMNEATQQLVEAEAASKEGGNEMDPNQLERNVELAADQLSEAKARLEEKLEGQKRILTADENRKQRIQQSKKVQHWNKVNEKAAKLNQNADFDSYKTQREQRIKEDAETGEPKFNPYARRKVKPKMLWEVGQHDKSKEGIISEKKDGDTASKNTPAAVVHKRDDSDEMNHKEKDNKRDEYLGSPQKVPLVGQMHQFAIDDQVLLRVGGAVALARVRKGISLTEYQERKAAGTL